MRLVKIEWVDSVRPDPEWRYMGDLPEPSIVKCCSVGWLVSDGEVKMLAPNIGDQESESAQVCGVIQIPAASITRMVDLAEVTSWLLG